MTITDRIFETYPSFSRSGCARLLCVEERRKSGRPVRLLAVRGPGVQMRAGDDRWPSPPGQPPSLIGGPLQADQLPCKA